MEQEVGIEGILKVTGLSCDDLINKLLLYKTAKITQNNEVEKNNISTTNCDVLEQKVEEHSKNKDDNLSHPPLETGREMSTASSTVVQAEPSSSTTKDYNSSPNNDDLANDQIISRVKEQLRLLRTRKKVPVETKNPISDERMAAINKRRLHSQRIAAEDRLMAAKRLDRSKLPVIVDKVDISKLPTYESDLLDVKAKKRKMSDILLKRFAATESEALNSPEVITIDDDDDEPDVDNVTPAVEKIADVIKPRKTNDIKKIKGWRHKVFDVSTADETGTLNENMEVDRIAKKENKRTRKVEVAKKIEEQNARRKEAEENAKKNQEEEDAKKEEDPKKDLEGRKLKNVKIDYIPNSDPFCSEAVNSFLGGETISCVNNLASTFESETSIKVARPKSADRTGNSGKNKNNTPATPGPKPRTVAEKRRLDEMTRKQASRPHAKCDRNAIVCYNGEYLKVSATDAARRVDITETIKPRRKRKRKRQQTDEATETKRHASTETPIGASRSATTLQFKPGPLSKKASLRISHTDRFRTVVQRLPAVYFEVRPQSGKALDPRVMAYARYETFDVDAERAEFALTALRDVGTKKRRRRRMFRFLLPYVHNQKFIQMYKRIDGGASKEPSKPLPPSAPSPPPLVLPTQRDSSATTLSETVRGVIADMLDYVALKEEADTFVKDDEDARVDDERRCDSADANVQFARQSPANFEVIKKTGRSTKTSLELKRLNVKVIEVDIEQESDDEVNCAKLSCRHGCVCKSLSGNHPKNEHCSNVACIFECKCNWSPKHASVASSSGTGSSKIVLPAGTNLFANGTVNELELRAKSNLAPVEKEFTQTVIQSNNRTIIVGNNLERKKRQTKTPRKLADFINTSEQYFAEMRRVHQIKECDVKVQKLDLQHLVPFCMLHELYNCRCLQKKKEIVAAEASAECKTAKKTSKAANSNKRKSSKGDEERSLTTETTSNMVVFRPIPMLSRSLPEAVATAADDADESTGKKKRKQTFKGLRDSPIFIEETKEPALQRRKKPSRQTIYSQTNDALAFFSSIESSGKFELKGYDFYAAELLKMLRKKYGADGRFRMLPWSQFVEHYYKCHVFLWCHATTNSGKILITPCAISPAKDMVNIKTRHDLTNSLDFLLWLKAGKLPANKNPNNLCVVLVATETKNCWEIFGISNISRKSPGANEIAESDDGNANVASDAAPPEWYKIETLACTLLKLYCSDKEDKLTDWVSLPSTVHFAKWRKIYLRSNFSFFLMKKYDVRIKYNVLRQMAKEAVQSKKTKVLYAQRQVSTDTYISNTMRGIYAVPQYTHCVYIGPYPACEDEEDFETLRYANGKLINTDEFQKMFQYKELNKVKSSWLYTNIIFTYMFKSVPTILNGAKQVNAGGGGGDDDDVMDQSANPTKKKNGVEASLNRDVKCYNQMWDAFEKQQKFIVSSTVSALGYVRAYYLPNSSFVVCWPENDKPKVFANETAGLQWLKRYLDIFLTPVPCTFNVHLVVANTRPVKLAELTLAFLKSFPYVGAFGIIDKMNVKVRNALVSEKRVIAADLRQSIQQREQNMLLLMCSDIFNKLSMSKLNISTVDDFADCLKELLNSERSKNLEMLKEKRSLMRWNQVLQGHLQNHKEIVSPQTPASDGTPNGGGDTRTKEKRRSSAALDLLKANDDIHIEAVVSGGNKNKSSSAHAESNTKSDEVICLDSDSDGADVEHANDAVNVVKLLPRANKFIPLATLVSNMKRSSESNGLSNGSSKTVAPGATANLLPNKLEIAKARGNEPKGRIAIGCTKESNGSNAEVPACKLVRAKISKKCLDKAVAATAAATANANSATTDGNDNVIYKSAMFGNKLFKLKLIAKNT